MQPLQTDIQRQNAFNAAGLTPVQQQAVIKPTGFQQVSNPSLSLPSASTTTISNQNKIEQIPTINSTFNNLAQRGVTTDPNSGVATYANGQVVADTKTEDDAIQANLEMMKKTSDAVTADLISTIQSRFAQRKAEQADINNRQNKGITNALLMGGATGQGSSAQYAPISSEGIVGAQESYGVKRLAELDAQEADLIAEAKNAQRSGDFKLLEEKNRLIEKKRDEKIAEAKVLNDKIAKQNEKIREQEFRASRDTAIADLYAQGITSPTEILKALNETGGDMTLSEVDDALKSIVPAGLDDLVKTLRNNGAPQDVIQKVLNSQNINEAYKNAGNFAAGGTGIIGEYNFYRAQAEAKGQVPVSFQEYQNIDANRKKSIARAGVSTGAGTGGLNTKGQYASDLDAFLDNVTNTIPTKFGQNQYQSSLAKARTDADKIRTAATVVLKNSPATVKEAFAQQAVGMSSIDKAIKLLDEGTQTGVINAGKQYVYNVAGKDFDPKLAAINAYITGAIQPYRNIITGAAWGTQEDGEYQQLFGSTKYSPKELRERLIRIKDMMKDKSVQGLSSQVDPFGTGQNFFATSTNTIQSEEAAQEAVISYGNEHPDQQAYIIDLNEMIDPELGRPYTSSEIQQILGI